MELNPFNKMRAIGHSTTLKTCWLLIFLVSSQAASANIVEQVCKSTTLPDICISALKLDPRSATADEKGLAHILIEIALAKAEEDLALIKKLADQAPASSWLKKTLEDCADDYNVAIVRDLPAAITILDENNLIVAAYADVTMAKGAPEMCEDEFSLTPGVKSPITAINKYFYDLCQLILEILIQMLPM